MFHTTNKRSAPIRLIMVALALAVLILFSVFLSSLQLYSPFSVFAKGIEESPVAPKENSHVETLDPAEMFGLAKASYSAVLYGVADPTVKTDSESDAIEEETQQMNLNSQGAFCDTEAEMDLENFYRVDFEMSAEEYDMLLFCVDHEAKGGVLKHRMMVTQVILNRVASPRFPNTLGEVLNTPGQFDVMPWYENRGDWTPTETTVQAVNNVLSGLSYDMVCGSLYFCNPYIVGEGNWFDTNLEAVAEIEGHRFYR